MPEKLRQPVPRPRSSQLRSFEAERTCLQHIHYGPAFRICLCSPSCSNNKDVFVPLAAKRMILHWSFWASILLGKVGPALQFQTSGMSVLAPSQSLPTLSVKSGPQGAATTASPCRELLISGSGWWGRALCLDTVWQASCGVQKPQCLSVVIWL